MRSNKNPIITPKDVKPSRENFKVDGVFNCGVTKYNDEIILLCRVAESVINLNKDEIKIPIVSNIDNNYKITIITINKEEHPEYIFDDSRSIWSKDSKGMPQIEYLTSLSHLRIARSKDGTNFKIDDTAFAFPNSEYEEWGMEDPRVTKIHDTYYINYTAVSKLGAATALITTKDFIHIERKGIIFAPENKDIAIFPEKINEKYMAFNRPVPKAIGNPDMWIAESPDLIHWGNQKHFYGVSEEDSWDNGRIGGGAPPIKLNEGWLKIYHAADKNNRYCLGAFLLDLNNPCKIIGKSKVPILEPEMEYEKIGFFGNVVFTCGCIQEEKNLKIYYGAADDKICLAELSIESILQSMV